MKVKQEKRFARLSYSCSEPNDVGRRQFVEHQSLGLVPEKPNPYYVALSAGKRWWDWTVEQYREAYFDGRSGHWHGWLQAEKDFRDDPEGLEIIRKAIGVENMTNKVAHRVIVRHT